MLVFSWLSWSGIFINSSYVGGASFIEIVVEMGSESKLTGWVIRWSWNIWNADEEVAEEGIVLLA